jgi:hypothetical protein
MMTDVVRNPGPRDHFVQLYGELEPLAAAVGEYIGTGLARGEAAVVIATPEHRAAFLAKLNAGPGLRILDAEETLASFMVNGRPQWNAFHRVVGGQIAQLRLEYPAVRAYGEMVDVLWQRGSRDAAIRLERYWNELAKLQTFSLFCAYRMDPLDAGVYGGPLECVCDAHTHLIPAPDSRRFDEAVSRAARKMLHAPLAQILLALAANHQPHMPAGQAMLFWLRQNMPRTADRILSELRALRTEAS